MGQVLHGSATPTEAIRRAIQHSRESLRMLVKRMASTEDRCKMEEAILSDLPTGPSEPQSTI
jgi:hypothetical protein